MFGIAIDNVFVNWAKNYTITINRKGDSWQPKSGWNAIILIHINVDNTNITFTGLQ